MSGRKLRGLLFQGLMFLSLAVAIAALGWLLVSTFIDGIGSVNGNLLARR